MINKTDKNLESRIDTLERTLKNVLERIKTLEEMVIKEPDEDENLDDDEDIIEET